MVRCHQIDVHRTELIQIDTVSDNVAYTCKLKAYNGRLNLEKCVDLDIPATLIKKLSLYESISLPDGRTITQHDVYDFIDDEKNFIGSYETETPFATNEC